ncbi:unnamed protein product [Rhizophagus irregularis]|nr:unnamed protein product [Rhizophagus irregularis]
MGRLNEEERIRICTLLEKSIYSPSDLARKYKVSVSTITRLYEKFQKTKSVKDLPKTGRPHLLTQRTERRAARYIISGECSTTVQKNDLKSMIKVKKPLLLPRHKKARYEFAKKYKHWSIDDWKKVVWSDESKFNVFGSDGREYCIGYLCRIDGGMDAELYCKILEEDFLMTLDYYDLDVVDVVFQHDNNPKHKARITTDCLWEKIQTSWNNIETEVCTKLIETMLRRIEDVIKQKEGYTKW